jgi:TRAP-type transport system periplasmic protein
MSKAILDVGAEMEAFGTAEAKRDDEEAAKVFREKRAEIIDLSPFDLEKWRAIAQATAWKDFSLKSPETAELLASARSLD